MWAITVFKCGCGEDIRECLTSLSSFKRWIADCVSVSGRLGIGNTKYHKPYLAVVDEFGEFVWQERVYVGYGKHQQCYYIVEGLNIGDVIQAAGGVG